MGPIAKALIVLVCVFASGVLGLSLRSVLPHRHLQEDSLTMVRLCTGVIATLTALVLGLLVASAKANYDRAINQVTSAAAAVVLLDRTLAQYGPQTAEVRSSLRAAVVILVLWLSIMFAGFGLVTAKNPTVLVTLFQCAVSVAGAVLMIEELNQPLVGLLKVSSEPMHYALAHLGQ